MLPIVGIVIQIWKRAILSNELSAFNSEKNDGNIAFTRIKIKDLDSQSYKFGKIADIAIVISGIALIGTASPFVVQALIATGVTTLLARKFMTLFGIPRLL
jgi:hypothetical protein